MKPTFKILIQSLVLLLIPVCAGANEPTQSKKAAEIGLKEAIEQKMVLVNITGSNDPEVYAESVDQEGLHYGKCMVISLKSNIDSSIAVRLDCGTLLLPDDSEVQIMVATHNVSIELKPKEKFATRFYAMCTQMHKFAPTVDETFIVGTSADSTLTALVRHLQLTYNQNLIGQHALWAYTDHANSTDLEAYGADSISIKRTICILDDAGISTDLNKRIAKPEPVAISLTPAPKNYLPLWLAALGSVLATALTYFMVKSIRTIRLNNNMIRQFQMQCFNFIS